MFASSRAHPLRALLLFVPALLCSVVLSPLLWAQQTKHLLYVVSPGLRAELDHGGIGVLIFDMDHDFRFVQRFPTWPLAQDGTAEPVKGVVADAKSNRLYVTTITRVAAFDLLTEKMIWDKPQEGGCDRLAISPDGTTLYVPALEGLWWNVVNAENGEHVARVTGGAGSHNTYWADDSSRVYMSGLHFNYLLLADPRTNTVASRVGPFDDSIRPFVVNGSNTRVYADVDHLLGFQIGDLKTGKVLHKVVVEGFKSGHADHHSTPSHGIGLSADEKEIWLADGVNHYLHVFDATRSPPKQIASIKNEFMPGWISMSIDDKWVFDSTGEIVDRKAKKIVYRLKDENGIRVQSEKLLEIDFQNGKAITAGSSFAVGKVRK